MYMIEQKPLTGFRGDAPKSNQRKWYKTRTLASTMHLQSQEVNLQKQWGIDRKQNTLWRGIISWKEMTHSPLFVVWERQTLWTQSSIASPDCEIRHEGLQSGGNRHRTLFTMYTSPVTVDLAWYVIRVSRISDGHTSIQFYHCLLV